MIETLIATSVSAFFGGAISSAFTSKKAKMFFKVFKEALETRRWDDLETFLIQYPKYRNKVMEFAISTFNLEDMYDMVTNKPLPGKEEEIELWDTLLSISTGTYTNK